MADADYPLPSDASLISRTTSGTEVHEWTGNDDDQGQHHGLLNANEVPCYIALYWQSRKAGRTVHVGTYRANLRQLVKRGLARYEGKSKVRLRFVRQEDSTIVIQLNESAPSLRVGRAVFN
jgi:hypothetical protein